MLQATWLWPRSGPYVSGTLGALLNGFQFWLCGPGPGLPLLFPHL